MNQLARELLAKQMALENEGAQACRDGKQTWQCPYDQFDHAPQWNHWMYGYRNEEGKNT